MNVDPPVLSDAALTAFVWWCRLNPIAIVTDTIITRGVFDAYARTPLLACTETSAE